MECRFVEVSNGFNWGKFMLCRFTGEEWYYESQLPDGGGHPLLRSIGKDPRCLWVLDVQTGEGALFVPKGMASADLEKHSIWVCPMFEPFLTWLYAQPDPWATPAFVELPPETPGALYGYRREGVGAAAEIARLDGALRRTPLPCNCGAASQSWDGWEAQGLFEDLPSGRIRVHNRDERPCDPPEGREA